MIDDFSAARDANALYIGNLNTVEFDLALPETGAEGSKIEWHSENTRFLSDEGKVTRPKYGMGDRKVRLTAVVDDGQHQTERVFIVNILEAANDIKIRKAFPVQLSGQKGKPIRLPAACVIETMEGETVAHAVTWQNKEPAFEECGTYQEQGTVSGTSFPVEACIEIQEQDPTAYQDAGLLREAVPLNDIRLLEGSPFYQAQQRMLHFLLKVNDDQMLYNFRQTSGLDTKGAPAMIGWDAPECKLRGHTTGHYLSALALCYAATGEEAIREKAVYMARSLSACQEAFSRLEGYRPGYLGAYPEDQFDQLEHYVRYPEIWAPYYTLHKILAGLLDVYEWVGEEKAGETAKKLGLWAAERLSRLSPEQLVKMWSLYIAGEYGGMNEVMARLYRIFGDDRFLEAARLFDNDKLFYPMEHHIDTLSGMHGNQHIPQAIGALAMFEATGEKRYYEIASFFRRAVETAHTYAIGGTGEGEMFRTPFSIAGTLSDHTAESCASYNMLKLTAGLYAHDPQDLLMDAYERTLFNHILAAAEKSELGRTTYFMPLKGPARKTFDDENSCCHGTGMESPFRFAQASAYRSGEDLYLTQWIPMELIEEGVSMEVRVEETGLRVTARFRKDRDGSVTLRKPAWTDINEEDLTLRGPIRTGQEWSVLLPCQTRFEPTPDDPSLGAFLWGPFVLACPTEEEGIPVSVACPEKREGELVFSDGEHTYVPFYQIDHETYHVYVKKPETQAKN